MKTAFTYQDNRIAPLFDTTELLHVIEYDDERTVVETVVEFGGRLPTQKVSHLVELRINAIVCGAISRQMFYMISLNGVQVYPFVTGDLHVVVKAWMKGERRFDRFSMPGCRGRIRQWDDEMEFYNSEMGLMKGRGQGQGGGAGRQGGGAGRQGGGAGRQGGGAGRKGGGAGRQGGGDSQYGPGLQSNPGRSDDLLGPVGGRKAELENIRGNRERISTKGDCVCVECGQRTPHERGVPCRQQMCPHCGSAMKHDT